MSRDTASPEIFSRARLDPGLRTICLDGLVRDIAAPGTELDAPSDLCPDVLYELSALWRMMPIGQPQRTSGCQMESSRLFEG
jgi:hypothetical protein